MIINNFRKKQDKDFSYCLADVTVKGKTETVYIGVKNGHKDFLTLDPSAFLAAFLLPSSQIGENLQIEGKVSARLLSSCSQVLNLVKSWKLGFKEITVSSAGIVQTHSRKNQSHGLFFSGGVDSFYTYFKQKETLQKITHFLFIQGFDIDLDDQALYSKILKQIKKISQAEKIPVVEVRTNLKKVLDKYLDWSYSHGGGLAGIGLVLGRGFKSIYFSGALEYEALRPYGMHPDLDPLWSTETTQFIHIGAEVTRLKKIMVISQFQIVLDTLRVCWRNTRGSYNCGQCEKCLRTMVALYAVGTLDKTKTFPQTIDKNKLEKLYIDPGFFRYYQHAVLKIEKNADPQNIAQSIKNCLAWNSRRFNLLAMVTKLKDFVGNWDTKHTGGRFSRLYYRSGLINIV